MLTQVRWGTLPLSMPRPLDWCQHQPHTVVTVDTGILSWPEFSRVAPCGVALGHFIMWYNHMFAIIYVYVGSHIYHVPFGQPLDLLNQDEDQVLFVWYSQFSPSITYHFHHHFNINFTYWIYHSHTHHTYTLIEVILFWSNVCPPYWMKATAVAFHQSTRCNYPDGHQQAICVGVSLNFI